MQATIKGLEDEKRHLQHNANRHKEEADLRQHELFDKYITETEIYKQIVQIIAKHKDGVNNQELLSATQWDEISQAIDLGNSDFTSRLSQQYPALKTEDIHFCCLLKMKFKYAEIACLLGRTSNMMYKRRNLIAQRMNLDTAISLDKYIKNF